MSNSSFYSNTGITSADVSSITSSKEAAATSETNAATSATNAATSATQAATSATNAATSETNAATSATNAATSASSVGTSETNASASAATATTQASNAATSATAAAGSASAANTSKTNAASSETNAATSATNAATSATSAATSATSAGTSATNAATSETNAAASSSSASGYVTSATTQANNAATSATAAATSETNAATSATAASTSASGASTSASNANTSATNAASSASQAATSAAAAALAADNFDDTYLGSNSSDPAEDNDGDALNAGDLHFNTSSNTLKVYNGSAWQDAAVDSSGFVQTTGDTLTGVLTFASSQTFDGRDVSADGTKLDTIETNADVTDATNVTAAGALMDSELANIAAVKALNQGVATTDDPTFTNTQLAALAATISDTAVDIFVYDTSKDSDGGAWRKRTQHTSWYNETLNTATRGSRREFPAVAVIVAESNQVTIYDGDDPDMPMWFKSRSTSTTIGLGVLRLLETYTPTCVSAANGKIFVGINLTSGTHINNEGVHYLDFAKDEAGKYSSSSSYTGRVTPLTAYPSTDISLDSNMVQIVDPNINDVAMTVLPNAPIDAATGLPVSTIAVATDGGLCAIKDDGTVTSVLGNAGEKIYAVDFVRDGTGDIWYGSTYEHLKRITLDNQTLNWWTSFDSGSATPYSGWYASVSGSGRDPHKVATLDANTAAAAPQQSEGFSLHRFNGTQGSGSDQFKGSPSVAYVSKDFNTGHMVGDIKLATLSDTDDTDVTGTELVTNGTFDSDTSGWTANNATLSVDAGRLKIVDNGSSASARQTISVTAGETYVITFDATAGTATCQAYVSDGTFTVIGSNIPDGAFSYTYTAPSGVSSFELGLNNNNGITGEYCFFDNVSVRLAEEDRSVNNNGLQVFGTVTKNPVATGADLVAYSGFSSSNYLVQPYNSDLDFGTDDFCIMYWVKTSDHYYTVVDRNDGEGFGLYTSGTSPNSRLRLIIGSTTIDSADTTILTTDTWTQVVVLRRSSTNIEYYINGTLFDTDTISSSLSASSPSELPARVGVRGDGAQHLTGSLALLRISATAPSPEQIAKIYEDEKFLFQENAQATLYGSSDAVTALAYDNTTELLHVGTSAGRSVFQGLRRVDNTTDAVGAAISASNGLVAED